MKYQHSLENTQQPKRVLKLGFLSLGGLDTRFKGLRRANNLTPRPSCVFAFKHLKVLSKNTLASCVLKFLLTIIIIYFFKWSLQIFFLIKCYKLNIKSYCYLIMILTMPKSTCIHALHSLDSSPMPFAYHSIIILSTYVHH